MGLGVGLKVAAEIGKRVVTSGASAVRFSKAGNLASTARVGATAAKTAATRAYAALPAAKQAALVNTGYAAGGLAAGAAVTTAARKIG